MHRLAEDLAREVVQRDVDRRHRVQRDAAVAEMDALLVQVVPDRLDVERIAPDQQLGETLRDGVRRRHLDRRPRDCRSGVALADPVEALVGLDADEERILRPVCTELDLGKPKDDRLDAGDAHVAPLYGSACPLR